MNRRNFLARTGVAMASLGAGLPLAAGQTAAASPRMPVYVFSKHLQFLGWAELAETSARLGFDGVDLTVRPNGHVRPERVRTDLPKALEAIRRAGQRVETISTGVLDAADPVARELLEVARDQGIRQYRIGSARYRMSDAPDVEQQIREWNAAMQAVAKLNQSVGLLGSIQNHSNHYLGGLMVDLWDAIKDADPAWTGCHYDIAHAVAEATVSWRVGFNLLAPRISALIIKDFEFNRTERGIYPRWVPLGSGMVPWDLYWPLVRQLGRPLPLILHAEYTGKDPEAVLRFLEQDLKTLRAMLAQPFTAA